MCMLYDLTENQPCEFLYLGKPILQLQDIFAVFSSAGRNLLQFHGKGASGTKMKSHHFEALTPHLTFQHGPRFLESLAGAEALKV